MSKSFLCCLVVVWAVTRLPFPNPPLQPPPPLDPHPRPLSIHICCFVTNCRCVVRCARRVVRLGGWRHLKINCLCWRALWWAQVSRAAMVLLLQAGTASHLGAIACQETTVRFANSVMCCCVALLRRVVVGDGFVVETGTGTSTGCFLLLRLALCASSTTPPALLSLLLLPPPSPPKTLTYTQLATRAMQQWASTPCPKP